MLWWLRYSFASFLPDQMFHYFLYCHQNMCTKHVMIVCSYRLLLSCALIVCSYCLLLSSALIGTFDIWKQNLRPSCLKYQMIFYKLLPNSLNMLSWNWVKSTLLFMERNKQTRWSHIMHFWDCLNRDAYKNMLININWNYKHVNIWTC